MKQRTIQGYTTGNIAGIVLLLYMAICTGCSKSDDQPTPVVQPPVVVSPPSGVIQTFVITDSLVPFNTGSTVKWLVNGTNNQTVVTFNGVIVGITGVLDTGPLKKTSVFTLAINNGKQASITLKVADSVTSILWGGGKFWKQTRSQVFIIPPGKTSYELVDTPVAAQIADQRIFFNFDGSSKIIQATSSRYVSPGDVGKFVVNNAQTTITWQGILFTIYSIDVDDLVLSFDALQANGTRIHTYYTYRRV
jgi:hypothetical protein